MCDCKDDVDAFASGAHDLDFGAYIWLVFLIAAFITAAVLIFFCCELMSRSTALKGSMIPYMSNDIIVGMDNAGFKRAEDADTLSTVPDKVDMKYTAQAGLSPLPVFDQRGSDYEPIQEITSNNVPKTAFSRTIPNHRSLSIAPFPNPLIPHRFNSPPFTKNSALDNSSVPNIISPSSLSPVFASDGSRRLDDDLALTAFPASNAQVIPPPPKPSRNKDALENKGTLDFSHLPVVDHNEMKEVKHIIPKKHEIPIPNRGIIYSGAIRRATAPIEKASVDSNIFETEQEVRPNSRNFITAAQPLATLESNALAPVAAESVGRGQKLLNDSNQSQKTASSFDPNRYVAMPDGDMVSFKTGQQTSRIIDHLQEPKPSAVCDSALSQRSLMKTVRNEYQKSLPGSQLNSITEIPNAPTKNRGINLTSNSRLNMEPITSDSTKILSHTELENVRSGVISHMQDNFTETNFTKSNMVNFKSPTFPLHNDSSAFGASSNILANDILAWLMRNQQNSDTLHSQVKSLESKLEFLTWELGRRIDSSIYLAGRGQHMTYTGGEYQHSRPVEERRIATTPAQNGSLSYNVREYKVDGDTTDPEYYHKYRPRTIQTTTEVISVEAVPVKSQPPPPPTLIRPQQISKRFELSNSNEYGEIIENLSDSRSQLNIPVIKVHQKFVPNNPVVETRNLNELGFEIQAASSSQLSNNDLITRRIYERQFAETVELLKTECQKRILENQEEQRLLSSVRVLGLEKEVGSLISSLSSQTSVLDSLQWKLVNVEKSVSALANEKVLLENCTREVRSGWESDKQSFETEKLRLEALLIRMRAERHELVGSYEHLLEAKVALDSELQKYKLLIEAEENRY